MALRTIDLGPVSSYAIAVEKGYTGTETEWYELIHSVTENAQTASDAAVSAGESAAAAAQALEDIGPEKDAAIAAIQEEGGTQTGAVTAEGTAQIALVKDAKDLAIAAVQAQQGISEQAVYDKGTQQETRVTGAGDDAVAAITAEGTAQVAAVGEKGDEIIASIPQDYSDFSGTVGMIRDKLGQRSANLLPPVYAKVTVNSVDITYSNGKFVLNGTASASGGRATHIVEFTLPAGTYYVNRPEAVSASPYIQNGNTQLATVTQTGNSFTLAAETTVNVGVNVTNETVYSNATFHIMLVSGSSAADYADPLYSANDIVARGYGPNQYAGKTWVVVGDSLTEVNSAATKRYFDFISEQTGITVVNMGLGGTGYIKLRVDQDEQPIQNTRFFERITSDLPSSGVDVVTIFGSGNDINPNDGTGRTWTQILGEPSDSYDGTGNPTICGCVNAAIDVIYTKLPLVRLVIILPTPWKGAWNATEKRLADATDTDNTFRKWYTYTEAIRTICYNRGIPCLDLFRKSSLRPWETSYAAVVYDKDLDGQGNIRGQHPNEIGHAIIAPIIKQALDEVMPK